MAKKAIIERNYFHTAATDQARRLEVANQECNVLRKEARLNASMAKQLSQEVRSQDQQLKDQERELENRSAEIKVLTAKLAEAEEGVGRFLKSGAFTQAAPLACLDAMKYVVYRELSKVGKFYHFTPEQAGFAEIPAESSGVRKLDGFKWDEKEDRLIKPDGTVFNEKLSIEDHPPVKFPHPWKGKWPADLDVAEEDSDEEMDDVEDVEGEISKHLENLGSEEGVIGGELVDQPTPDVAPPVVISEVSGVLPENPIDHS